ncbi:hypothetical protein HGM15179_008489 [Zosterops borbonicus]|uniref:Uncharacterized protein n=1 Tax=Zosterops borbonicus TaxID=364589 RepID=A0A8K1GIA5_9PASS|nr:hypothetical protein HGM15179_008489 [Zosterops borbonicus]
MKQPKLQEEAKLSDFHYVYSWGKSLTEPRRKSRKWQDEAFFTAENKPIKANSAYPNKSDESIQEDQYCLVFHPLYPSVLKLDKACS